jgi:hypothetical protein
MTRSTVTTRVPSNSLQEDVYPNTNNNAYVEGQSSPLQYCYTRARDAEANNPVSQWKFVKAYVRRVFKDAGPQGSYLLLCSTDTAIVDPVESVPDGVESLSNAILKFTCYRVYGHSSSIPQINQIVEISVPITDDQSIECSLIRVTPDYMDSISLQSEELQDSSTAQQLFFLPPPKPIGSPPE